jgi:alkanesulfonate monooxygenase SsuD/methylene tetrahydromethanopterin reductase-like flavin-dependent oxidoreductase (luciferase family)
MTDTKYGILLWNQATDWPSYAAAVRRLEDLGYAHLWAWDHLYAIFGDPYQPIFEGWSSLVAAAGITKRMRLGLLVGANTFRNPGLQAKLAATLDHVSDGRAILGVGGAWMEPEHTQHGIEFGTGFGQRLDWLDESVGLLRDLLDGKRVSHGGPHYRMEDAAVIPSPVQAHLPILIGGSGERKTLRTVARYADLWNGMGTVEKMAHKIEVLWEHCAAVGRDPADIELTLNCKLTIRDSREAAERALREKLARNRTAPDEVLGEEGICWLGRPDEIAATILRYRELGFTTVVNELPAPYDVETIERFIGEVKPLVEGRAGPAPARPFEGSGRSKAP